MTTSTTPLSAFSSPGPAAPALPAPRGPLSAAVLERLLQPCRPLPSMLPSAQGDPLWGDDAQLTLYCCYELHYQSFQQVDAAWEWEPSLLALRRRLEGTFERRLAEEVGPVVLPRGDVAAALEEALHRDGGPSLSRFMEEAGTIGHLREFAVHRSAYQLKEADPHTWAIPRLRGAPKAALIEIQMDEYGRGDEAAMHSTLFADTLDGLGLDSSYGAYLDLLPGTTLVTTNLMSLFGLHRRWRGALAGHLAMFEATSVQPMRRYRNALRRLGVGPDAQRFYDVHVEVDAHHEEVAWNALTTGLAAAEPAIASDIVFGARALMVVEEHFARHLLGAWAAGRSSLLGPLSPFVAVRP